MNQVSLAKHPNSESVFQLHRKLKNIQLINQSVEEKINRLKPNDLYISRTAPLTSKRCILYIYSTNIGTEYFKHALYSPLSLQNPVCFIMLTSLVPVLFTFYTQGVLKLKKNNSGAKGLIYIKHKHSGPTAQRTQNSSILKINQ